MDAQQLAKSFLSSLVLTPQPDSPCVTLTYAQSLDGKIAGENGKQILLSGKESLVMTHRLRAMHDGIMVGIGTLINDDPLLTARLLEPNEVVQQPQPIILDSTLDRFPFHCRLLKAASNGTGKCPWIFVREGHNQHHAEKLRSIGCRIFPVPERLGYVSLPHILSALRKENLGSLMVEGGAGIIQSFLQQRHLVSHVIVTIAPVFVGSGVNASGKLQPVEGSYPRVHHVVYERFGQDIVMLGRLDASNE
ncbi:uncharacterized protein VTP21DRAFT_10992 [Calcarisporiella thermophila]|uniref:uncharacterized protein n=1 Tax=Calcarisporiella thermophila TaxID=911321 RepID=UPI003741F06E